MFLAGRTEPSQHAAPAGLAQAGSAAVEVLPPDHAQCAVMPLASAEHAWHLCPVRGHGMYQHANKCRCMAGKLYSAQLWCTKKCDMSLRLYARDAIP